VAERGVPEGLISRRRAFWPLAARPECRVILRGPDWGEGDERR